MGKSKGEIGHPSDGNFSQVSNDFIDQYMSELNGNSVKVMLYILRRTVGFQKAHDAIGYDQFTKGITQRDGTRLDAGTGLTVKSVKRAVAELEAAGLIWVHQRQSKTTGEWLPSVYEPNLVGQSRYRYASNEFNPRLQPEDPDDSDLSISPTVTFEETESENSSDFTPPIEQNLQGGLVDMTRGSGRYDQRVSTVDTPSTNNDLENASKIEPLQKLKREAVQPGQGLNSNSLETTSLELVEPVSERDRGLVDMTRGSGRYDQRVYPQRPEGLVDMTNTKESSKIKLTKEIHHEEQKKEFGNEGNQLTDVRSSAEALPPFKPVNPFRKAGEQGNQILNRTRLSYDTVITWLFSRYQVANQLDAGRAAKFASENGISPERLDALGQEARRATLEERPNVFSDLLNREVDISLEQLASG